MYKRDKIGGVDSARKNRKALSNVMTALLIILVATFAVILVWMFMSGFFKMKIEEIKIKTFSLDANLEIKEVRINRTDNQTLLLKISRGVKNNEEVSLDAVKFVLTDTSGKTYSYIDTETASEHQDLETRDYSIYAKNVSGLADFSNITYIEITQGIKASSGQNVFTNVLSSYKVTGGGGGRSGGGGGNEKTPVCTPNCGRKQCGDNGCGESCGSCDIGYVCNLSYQCSPCVIDLANITSEWTNISCLSNDKMNQTRNMTQYDINNCGEIANITFIEYKTTEICDFCTPSWKQVNTTCNIYDSFISWYNDTNSCFSKTGLADDNNAPANQTFSCNYCSENIIVNYSSWNACNIFDNQTRTKYYHDLNYGSCCLITGLSSDCHINNGSYLNVTEINGCNYCSYNVTNTTWSSWQNQTICLANDNQTQNQSRIEYDSNYNSCYAVTHLPSDLWNNGNNITFWNFRNISCNYCSENISSALYTAWSSCNSSGNQSRIKYFSDYNYNSCCAITNLISDCHINNASYANVTEIGSCNYSASSSIIPDDRKIDWSSAGVSGGIPYRTNICSTLNPGATASQINTAIQNCNNGVVYLNAGNYNLETGIVLKSNVTLRGAGMGRTILKGQSGVDTNYLLSVTPSNFDWDYSQSTPRNLASTGLAKDSNSITTTSAHGWSVGDYVLIDQLSDPTGNPPISEQGGSGACTWCGRSSGTRPIGQWAKITGVPTSTTATIEPSLHWNYDITKTPQGYKIPSVMTYAGVESLTLDNSASGTYDTIHLYFAANSWLLNVEAIGSVRRMVDIYGGVFNTIQACSFHEGVPSTPIVGDHYGPNRAYGVFLGNDATSMLIENNLFYHLSLMTSLEGAPSGNVIAYNYYRDSYYNNLDWGRLTIGMHGAHPKMNLIEGNIAEDKFDADYYWGTSSHQTFFRNRMFNIPNKVYGSWGFDIYKGQHYYSIVGNVFGTSYENKYELTGDFDYMNDKSIYKLGYIDAGDSGASGNDAQVKATLYRYANWDSVHNCIWNDSSSSCITNPALPNSLYLTSKPSFYPADMPWPSIDPSTPGTATNPAKYCWDNFNSSVTDMMNCLSGSAQVIICSTNASCNDGNQCTQDICMNPGLNTSYCRYVNYTSSTSCNDGITCTQNDRCNGAGNCVPNIFNNSLCADNPLCTTKTCSLSGCSYSNCTSTTPSGLVAWYKFDETSGTTALDSSGNGKHGTLINNPTWTIGNKSNALSFDGVDDYVSVNVALPDSYTAAMWIYPVSDSQWQSLLAEAEAYTMQYYGDDHLNFWYQGSGDITSTGTVSKNRWSHVAFVKNGNSVTFYINGAAAGSGTTTAPAITISQIGTDSGNLAYGGRIDDLKLFNKSLNSTEILSLYNSQ
jgi:hypothetical protein